MNIVVLFWFAIVAMAAMVAVISVIAVIIKGMPLMRGYAKYAGRVWRKG